MQLCYPDSILLEFSSFQSSIFQQSDGYLLITDFHGIKGLDNKLLFIDATIHSTDSLRFGDKNGGKQGMDLFFHRHLCNHFCTEFGLKQVSG